MILVELFSKEDCHLCDMAMETLTRIRTDHPFELKVIKIQEGDEHHQQFRERIPVVYINGDFAFQYRIPEKEFIRKLKDALHIAHR